MLNSIKALLMVYFCWIEMDKDITFKFDMDKVRTINNHEFKLYCTWGMIISFGWKSWQTFSRFQKLSSFPTTNIFPLDRGGQNFASQFEKKNLRRNLHGFVCYGKKGGWLQWMERTIRWKTSSIPSLLGSLLQLNEQKSTWIVESEIQCFISIVIHKTATHSLLQSIFAVKLRKHFSYSAYYFAYFGE